MSTGASQLVGSGRFHAERRFDGRHTRVYRVSQRRPSNGLPARAATRGNTHLDARDIHHAIDRGINYLNWCTHDDDLSEAVRSLETSRRSQVVLASQLYAHDGASAQKELDEQLRTLKTDRIDVVTFFYLETREEWDQISGASGALEVLERARTQGKVGLIGITSHQRPPAAEIGGAGEVDLLMIRYNAAHRGAEDDVFPVTRAHALPVIAYTCTRWGDLLTKTPADPESFHPPPAPMWYRFVLSSSVPQAGKLP